MARACRWLLAALAAVGACALGAADAGTGQSPTVVQLESYPYVVYVATPFTVCFGTLLTDSVVVTDARCLFPFSHDSGAPDSVRGTLGPQYFMVVLPKGDVSETMHNIYLSMQGFTSISLAGASASTFFGLVGTYVDNSTYFGVKSAAAHAYYAQSEYDERSGLNFDVGVVTLTHPVDGARLAQLYLDDLSDKDTVSVLSFAPPDTTDNPAAQQKLFKGMDLTKAQLTPVTPLSRSACDSNYLKAYDLKNMNSFTGHGLPGRNSPIYCSPIYANATECDPDTSISISSTAANARSTNLNSTLVLSGGPAPKVVSLGLPRLFEVRTDPDAPCWSNGFVQFARTGIYTDWIGWASEGSIAPNGSWIDKKLTGDVIADFVHPGAATPAASRYAVLLAAAASAVGVVAAFV
ncbi:hypothetical protein H4R18_002360 [Coemansia javaensis]|uniref:Peptidase S1 domain-containing protein n=1 Tax=Coemansia javaensis TaxID=2761396 RepID=A0A9W8HD55_9FUNG|nr:hypothetical protein H4R18_002360 [Coemansia javaensis]